MACQAISVITSLVSERSMVIVVESVSCARSILAPTSAPLPGDLKPTRTNVFVGSIGGLRVAVTEDTPVPMLEVAPVWTLIAAGSRNSMTCHRMTCDAFDSSARNWRFEVLVSCPTIGSSELHSLSEAAGVFDQVTKAWSTAPTAVGSVTSMTVESWPTSPRWTLTPLAYSTTYHWIPIVEVVSVTLVNSRDVGEAILPPSIEPEGRLLS
jgi:hypothetical protein